MSNKYINFITVLTEFHPFHIISSSPWPLLTSSSLMSTALGFIMYLNYFSEGNMHLYTAVSIIVGCLVGWFYDVIREATYLGYHTLKVQQNVILGMLLFLVSEAMFFFSFFWAFFHFSLSPSIWVGGQWPPMGLMSTLDPWSFPLLNTVLLLTSGIYITISHISMRLGKYDFVTISLIATIGHGIVFSFIQLYEYNVTSFSISDSVFGAIFYLTTGFHGLHVIIGTILLIVCLLRHLAMHFSKEHHVGFLCAVWYWHFVDVVWIFLYLCIYIWGR